MLEPALHSRLAHQLASFRSWVAGADAQDFAWTPPSGKWSALLNLAHVGRHHEVTLERVMRVQREETPVFAALRRGGRSVLGALEDAGDRAGVGGHLRAARRP